MVGILRPVLVLMVAVFLTMAGSAPLATLVSIRLEGMTTGPLAIGVVMAAYYAGLTLGSLLSYRIIVSVGHIRSFSAFASILSATALMYGLAPETVFWGVLRLTDGVCMAGLFVCVESWLNERATFGTRGKILAFYMSSLYVGQASGQFLLLLDGSLPLLPFIGMSILLSLAVVPVALTRMPAPALPDVVSLSFRRLYEASPLGVFGTLVSGLLIGAFYGLGPIFVHGSGFDVGSTALFMSTAIMGGVLLQWPVGRLSDLFDRRLVIVYVLAAVIVASGGMILAAGIGRPALLVSAALFGGVTFALYPLCVAHTNDHLEPAARIAGSGGLILASSAGATVGPLAASVGMVWLGPIGLFAFTGALGTAALVFALWRMRVRQPVPGELQGRFRALPQTTPLEASLSHTERDAPQEAP